MTKTLIKPIIYGCLSLACAVVGGETLTGAEIAQIENAFGITLSTNDIAQLSQIVCPTNIPAWRSGAYARIDAHRKADLDIRIVDQNGDPVEGAQVSVKLKSSQFKFGGVCTVMDLTDADGNLAAEGSTSNDWKRITTNLFNAVGLNNGFKPRITGQHEYLPGFLDWAAENSLDVRGHLLIWPGGGHLDDLDDTNAVSGVDYGDHLTRSYNSDYATHNVLGAVDAYKDSARGAPDKDALKAEVDAEITEWASQWDVYEWDVMNETIGNTLLQEILGFGQMAEWFKIAESNKVSSDIGLLINEFKIISADHTDSDVQYNSRKSTYTERIDSVITNGGPITGIGFQSRYKFGHIDPGTVYDRLDEFATLYPDMTFSGTEFEIKDGQVIGSVTNVYDEFTRAQMTEEILTAYFSHDQVNGLNAWDFMSPSSDPDPTEITAALALYDGTIKLNGLVWYYLHRIRYSTDATLASGLDGRTGLRAFKGETDVTVRYNGQTVLSSLVFTNDESIVITLNSTTADDPNTSAVIDAWNYDGLTNGAGLASAVSTGLVGGVSTPDYPLAFVMNETMRWQSDGITDSLYRNIIPSSSVGASNGLYQISIDYLDADFSASAVVSNGSGRVALGVRSDSAGDVNFRLVFDSGGGSSPEFRLEVSDDLGSNQELAAFSGTTLDQLSVRAVYDFDSSGTAGSYKVYYRLNGGSEVAAYTTGQLPVGFTLDQLRLMVQTYNGGVNWQTGDQVFTDNMVLRSLGEPPPSPMVVAIEDWQMNEGAGTNLSGLVNSAGSAVWSGDKDNVQTDGAGNLRITQGATSSDNLYRNSTLTQSGVTSGVYQLSFAYPAATLDGGDAAGASLGFGLRDETAGSDLFLVRLQRQNSELRLQTRIGTTNTDIYDFNATSLPGVLAVRAVIDLDADLMDLYYSIDGGAEILEADIAINDGVMDAMRMAGSLNTTDFGTADFIEVDYLALSQINEIGSSAGSLYQSWLADFPTLGSQTNLADNPDGDSLDNLAEYSLGSDPSVADMVNSPVLQQGSGGSLFYIHVQRSDAAERGLSYYLELTPDLAAPAWTNGGYAVIGTNTGYAAGFDAVTNLIPTDAEASQIIRLRVEIDYP